MEEPKEIEENLEPQSSPKETSPSLKSSPKETSPSLESSPILESPIPPTNTDTNHDATPVPNGINIPSDSSATSEEQTEPVDSLPPDKLENGDDTGEKKLEDKAEIIINEGKKEERIVRIESVRKKALENAAKNVYQNRGFIDTRAPFESVKEAVSKFGGITDWKAHRAQALERSKQIKLELEKLHEEMPIYKSRSEAAELEKSSLLSELESTKRLVEELKLNLEKAQTEESQAKQDSELAQLRAEEIEQGITDESSIAAKAQVDLAKSRYENAINELKLAEFEFSKLEEEYSSLIIERDLAIKRAEESILESKEVERRVEELTLELILTKENLELSHSVHLEAEEHRIGALLAKEQDCLSWEKELKEREDELKELKEKYESTKDLRVKLNEANNTLAKLKAELVEYMETKLTEEMNGTSETGTSEAIELKRSIEEALNNSKKELEEAKGNVDKAKIEVEILRAASVALKTEMENEKFTLSTLQQREGMASIAVSSLEAELERTKEELEVVRLKERETREKMVELPKILQQAAQEADEAKLLAQLAQEELKRAKEDLDQSKASLSTNEIRIKATLKEMEASSASEKLALDAINALQESEHQSLEIDSPKGITLHLDEFYALSKKAHDAEESAHEKVENALSQIEEAKESESKCLENLNEVYKEMEKKRENMKAALERDETAKQGKLGAEMELRKWRAENEQRRRANEALAKMGSVNPVRSPPRRSMVRNEERDEINELVQQEMDQKMILGERKLRRKKSFFPRVMMYIARKKAEGRG